MSMEITNSFSNYAANYAESTKKPDSKAAAEIKTNTQAGSKDKVQEYYQKLCKKFPEISFNTNGGLMSGNENKVVLNLSGKCLEKMANDPEFAKKVEFNLSGVVSGQNNMFAQAKADNAVIHGVTAVMDADGNVSVTCGGMTRTSGTKQSSTILNTEKKQKERLEKKRAEKKAAHEAKIETGSTKELSEAEEMAIFKKEFYAEIDKIPRDRTIANVAINISEEAFKNMKDDPEYREKVLSLIRRDMTGSVAPAPDCSMVITVGATAKDYRADSWSVNNDSEFYARSQNSFYKKTSVKKDSRKELLERYLEKRAQVKKYQQELLDEKIAKQEQENKVQEYYEKLCKKFPQINFNTNGGVLPSNSSKVTVNLSYDCLKKMANDPEFAKEIEWNLSGEVAANSMVYGWAKRDGVVLGGRTVTYDANGNRQSSCGGMRTANAGNGNSNTNKTQKKYKEEEERWLKARKRHEEREKFIEKIAEKWAERKEQMERAVQGAGFDIKA